MLTEVKCCACNRPILASFAFVRPFVDILRDVQQQDKGREGVADLNREDVIADARCSKCAKAAGSYTYQLPHALSSLTRLKGVARVAQEAQNSLTVQKTVTLAEVAVSHRRAEITAEDKARVRRESDEMRRRARAAASAEAIARAVGTAPLSAAATA